MIAAKAKANLMDGFPDSPAVLDTDALQAMTGKAGWHLTYLRSGSGTLVSRVVVCRIGSHVIAGTTTMHPVEMRGQLPLGIGGILLADTVDGVRCCGQVIQSGQIGVRMGGSKVNIQIPRDTAVFLAIVPEPFITSNLGLVASYRMRGQGQAVMECRPGNIESARSGIDAALAGLPDRGRRETVENKAVAALKTLLEGAKPVSPSENDYRSYRVLCAAQAYIDANLEGHISLADLSRHAGVTPRSLQRLFRRILWTTPVSYIRMRRLNAVRRALVEDASPGGNITSAALACGFANLGRFAAEYRSYFGVLPSESRVAAAASMSVVNRKRVSQSGY